MRIGLFGIKHLKQNNSSLQILVQELEYRGVDIGVYNFFYEQLEDQIHFQKPPFLFADNDNIGGKVDFLFSLGGDGTLLRTLNIVRDSQIPILGINLGRLGFLTTIGKSNIPEFVRHLIEGEYTVENRSLLHLESSPDLFGLLNFALNDISLHSIDSFSLLSADVFVNDEFLATYIGDGLIVATPTGSTAYSLSCGGPILSPDSNSFVITPIAAHTLTLRPIIIPDTSIVKLRFSKNIGKVYACLDSRRQILDNDTELVLRKENFGIKLVRMYGKGFFSTIREKLMWGEGGLKF